MNALRIVIVTVILIIGVSTITSCDSGNASYNMDARNAQLVGDSLPVGDTLRGQSQLLDSINGLLLQIKELREAEEANTAELNNLSDEVGSIKGSSKVGALICWVGFVIAVVMSIIAFAKVKAINRRANRHRYDINMLDQELKNLSASSVSSSGRVKPTSQTISRSEYSSLTARIGELERQLNQDAIKHDKILSGKADVEDRKPDAEALTPNHATTGFFGLPIQMSLTDAYFKRLSDSRETGSRFSAVVKNSGAEFSPLEGQQYLNDLRSNDAIKMALDIRGCAPSEATQMAVIMPGVAKKDGDRWIITKKATIALSR